MEPKNLINAVEALKQSSVKRNFKQSIDLIINVKDIDVKRTDQQIDFFAAVHYPRGKDIKICALVGPELQEQAKTSCNMVILADDFDALGKDKKKLKKIATEYDFFIAQATMMPKIAAVFGRVLGPKGKMPNPKAGCVVPPNANLKILVERLKNMVRIAIKTVPHIQIKVGNEESPVAEVADNIATIYNQVIHHMPKESNNIRSTLIKTTMGKPIKLSDSGNIFGKEVVEEEDKAKKGKKKK
jgi:large subunit ribosomal protein L1